MAKLKRYGSPGRPDPRIHLDTAKRGLSRVCLRQSVSKITRYHVGPSHEDCDPPIAALPSLLDKQRTILTELRASLIDYA